MTEPNKYEKMVKDAVGKRISRARAIRLKCLDCCVYQASEVTACSSTDCPLWRYRTGHEERDELYKPKMSATVKNGFESEF